MFLSINRSRKDAVYCQIRDGVIELIAAGMLRPGDKLPGTRELACQLGVSRKTVLQAYLELAADNYVESRPGSCTVVLDRAKLASGQTQPHSTVPLELLEPQRDEEAPVHPLPDADPMDWEPYQLTGSYFAKPIYEKRWHGQDEWISFSRAIPDVRLFPFERIKKVSGQMLWDPQSYFFDYGHPQGYFPLVEHVEMQLAKEGVPTGAGLNDVVICSGFQVALSLLLQLLLEPGDCVAVEDPTFNSILNLLAARKAPCRGIPMEPDGMDVDYLERVLERDKPRLIITIPTLHNPTGAVMSREKRLRLLELAQRHSVPIIEDNWSMMLGLDGRREPSLKTLDGGGHVIQVGSFSKAFLPGTRVAWACLPGGISTSLVKAKRAFDRSDSYFLQTLVYEFIRKGFMDLHCRKVDRIYKARRELMDEVMRQHFPSEVGWKKPPGGFSFWASLPAPHTSEQLLEKAIKHGVEFNIGNYFYVDRRATGNLRLAFSTLTQPQIRQGIRRLGRVLSDLLGTSAVRPEGRALPESAQRRVSS